MAIGRLQSIAFNTCEHQALPAMSGTPMPVHSRLDAMPKAFQSYTTPHHWKDKVKADVRLGIIELVPIGTPTVCCSKMIVVPKKDGTPRRTTDLQPLNAATYRVAHHTPSPFNQASTVPSNTVKTVRCMEWLPLFSLS